MFGQESPPFKKILSLFYFNNNCFTNYSVEEELRKDEAEPRLTRESWRAIP